MLRRFDPRQRLDSTAGLGGFSDCYCGEKLGREFINYYPGQPRPGPGYLGVGDGGGIICHTGFFHVSGGQGCG